MAEENNPIEPQPEGGDLQVKNPAEKVDDIVPQNVTPPENPEEDQNEDVKNTENQDGGTETEDGNNESGDNNQDGNNVTNDNNSNNGDQREEPPKNDGIDLSKLILEVEKYKKEKEEKRNKCVGWKLFLIVVCLIGVVCITRAFICDCEKITENVYAIVILYGLLALFIIGALLLSYLLVSCKRRYDLAINRLELLVTRLKIKNDNKNKSTIISDIDRELQLIARILETTHTKL